MNKSRLIIFDLDSTILANPDFYHKVYSGSLEILISKKRGDEGLEILRKCRENFDGKGELALLALNIHFRDWAKMLIETSLEAIDPAPELVEQIRKLNAIKVIYTGSPVKMVHRVLLRLGFSINDFDLIVGWQESEHFPIKWTRSSFVFEKIITQFNCAPEQSWAVGDEWDTDLMPAKAIGMKTAQIKNRSGESDFYFDTIQEFLKYFSDSL